MVLDVCIEVYTAHALYVASEDWIRAQISVLDILHWEVLFDWTLLLNM